LDEGCCSDKEESKSKTPEKVKKSKKNKKQKTGSTTASIPNLSNVRPKDKVKTLSNHGSCSSLNSFGPKTAEKPSGGLNQSQLDSLGPVVKMTLGGFPFSHAYNSSTQLNSE
jgi:hypothetical protein